MVNLQCAHRQEENHFRFWAFPKETDEWADNNFGEISWQEGIRIVKTYQEDRLPFIYSPADFFDQMMCRLPLDGVCVVMKFLVSPGKDVELITFSMAVDEYRNNVLIGRPYFRQDPADYGCLTSIGMTIE